MTLLFFLPLVVAFNRWTSLELYVLGWLSVEVVACKVIVLETLVLRLQCLSDEVLLPRYTTSL